MDIQTWLTAAAKQLHSSDSARLDALLLLELVTKQDRAWLLAYPEHILSGETLTKLQDLLQRREANEPMAYIRGTAAFYGRDFAVSDQVLVPRPESEAMIQLLKQCARADMHISDIGTGSGVLAITAALETGATVSAIDIDPACLKAAGRNAEEHKVSLTLLQGNLIEPLFTMTTSSDVLLCNLPYVPDNYPINAAAQYEPSVALFAGSDGLDHYRTLFDQLEKLPVQHVITESLFEQHDQLQQLATAHNYTLADSEGLAQHFKRLTA